MKKTKRKKGTFLITVGTLLIVAAVFLVVYNVVQSENARKISAEIADKISENAISVSDKTAYKEDEMPEITIDGLSCAGTIEIPALDIRLPILSEWSYPNLKKSPCRYSGSVYSDNLVIAAHNYRNHFGRISKLNKGDKILITDINGQIFTYQVDVVDVLNPADIDEMNSGVWPLTLFTCTVGGSYRVTVRCEKQK